MRGIAKTIVGLLILLTACASPPSKNWAESLAFHWREDLHRWEIATVGLLQFHADCKFTASEADDPVIFQNGKAYLTIAYYNTMLKACHQHRKQAALLMLPVRVETAGFRETSHCIVEGYAYGMPGEEPSFTRVDYCRDIESEVQGGNLLLTSVQSWVLIPLPTSGGQQRLLYRWGHDWAHLSAQEVHVQYGQIVKG